MISFKEFCQEFAGRDKLQIIISVNKTRFNDYHLQILDEAKKETIGRHTAYKHQPHFQGGEYHGHCDLPDGSQLSYTITGNRLHPNKFPADEKIPKDAKLAIAKVLGVSVTILEAFIAFDEAGQKLLLIEVNEESKAARLLRETIFLKG